MYTNLTYIFLFVNRYLKYFIRGIIIVINRFVFKLAVQAMYIYCFNKTLEVQGVIRELALLGNFIKKIYIHSLDYSVLIRFEFYYSLFKFSYGLPLLR